MEDGAKNKCHDANPGHCDHHGSVILPLVVEESGDNSERNANAHAEGEGEESEFKGDGEGFGDEGRDFAALHGEGVAKITFCQDVFPVVEILNWKGFIETVVGFESCLGFR